MGKGDAKTKRRGGLIFFWRILALFFPPKSKRKKKKKDFGILLWTIWYQNISNLLLAFMTATCHLSFILSLIFQLWQLGKKTHIFSFNFLSRIVLKIRWERLLWKVIYYDYYYYFVKNNITQITSESVITKISSIHVVLEKKKVNIF